MAKSGFTEAIDDIRHKLVESPWYGEEITGEVDPEVSEIGLPDFSFNPSEPAQEQQLLAQPDTHDPQALQPSEGGDVSIYSTEAERGDVSVHVGETERMPRDEYFRAWYNFDGAYTSIEQIGYGHSEPSLEASQEPLAIEHQPEIDIDR